jgi:hypothetical protein
MTTTIPAFDLGIDYREMHPEEGKRRWRWQSTRRNVLPLARDTGVHAAFLDGRGIERGRLEGDELIAHSDYAWNGCTPKRWVPVLGWVGTPDHERNLQASFWHDLLSQFLATEHLPFSQGQVDRIFLEIMVWNRFRWSNLYHGAVLDFGPLYKGPGDGSYSLTSTAKKG